MAETTAEHVYVIGSAESDLFKIGRSRRVDKRLAEIQRSSPVGLSVLWQTLGGAWLEAALHQHFKECRSHGEWFKFPARDAADQVREALGKILAHRTGTGQLRPEPLPQTEVKSFAGFSQGDVVLLPEDWPYAETGVIREIWRGNKEPFLIDANDGRRHQNLAMFKPGEITHQDSVVELPRVAPCRKDGCMCGSIDYESSTPLEVCP